MARVRLPVKKKGSKVSASSDSLKPRMIYPMNTISCSAELPESAKPGSKIVPWGVYCLIKEALELRKHLETNKNDEDSLLDLESAEGRLRKLAKLYMEIGHLPPDWQYDPATAKDFTAIKPSIDKRKDKCSFKGRDRCCAPLKKPLRLYPKTEDVPLNKEEKKIWKEFRKFDKDTPGLGAISLRDPEKERIPIKVDNPIVELVSLFAVTAFNEIIAKHVKPGQTDNLVACQVMECSYIKMDKTNYHFYMTIEAIEEEKYGVYETKVKLKWDDGRKSLSNFVLTDRTPCGNKDNFNGKVCVTPSVPVHLWNDPMGDKFTGMVPRSKRVNCVGYDYHTPWGFEGP